MQITPYLHKIDGFVNQYIVFENEELTLIDTGIPSNAKRILRYLKKIDISKVYLKRILITHSDSDHYGAANSIQSITRAEIYSSQIEADAMKTGSSSREIVPKGFFSLIFPLLRPFLSAPPISVDQIIKDGDILPIFDGLQVIASPGHTPGHLSFFFPKDRILFAGDAISARKGVPVPTTDATTGNPDQARTSFENLMLLNPQIICCGHAYFDYRK